ncbi:uncharacterized protein MELLADRAFT_95099 [Melampsora larici-populina 98AG31]|uniref:Uncharacterized protein n=1 Tax=Melampsora larici-populina (strain 98AG31 / pathotype 3-4-7) TaxID=747676 RepID=F4RCN1_MELLP|nr:uncharacterized protein MELLADRAFT_95099 [Melampsora larici-populina 98AG31]EGG10019.1 hypothetical protein MELLADRAFT_95099 [Melampsora larici-populina 98AG31]
MAAWANHNRDVAETLQGLLEAYDLGGGSTIYNMVSLRASFAQTIPFDNPHFHRHFSIFATEALAKDLRANRFVYPIGGQPPDPALPIQDTMPYIYPVHLLQNLRPNDQPEEDGGQGARRGLRRDMPGEGLEGRREEGGGGQPGQEEENRGTGDGPEGNNKRSLDDNSSDDSFQVSNPTSSASHVFTFIKTAKADEQVLPPEAKEITKLVLEYRTHDLNAAVLAFCWRSGKHHDFPDALVRDLLQYKFIDLEKINAGPTACKFDVYSKKDSDPASKIKPKPFKEATEWRDAVSLSYPSHTNAAIPLYIIPSRMLTVGYAFRALPGDVFVPQDCAKDSFRKYDRHLREMEKTFRDNAKLTFSCAMRPHTQGNWCMVVKYDIQLREAFATRRHLSFADFAKDELSHLKHLALAGRDEQHSSHQASTSASGSTSSAYVARSALSKPRPDKKQRTESPWAGKVKDTSSYPRKQQICGGWNLVGSALHIPPPHPSPRGIPNL